MRMLLTLTFAVCTTAIASWGQQTPAHRPRRADLIAQLRSDDVEVRSEAFDHLRSDSAALRSASVKAALVDLLDIENHHVMTREEEDYAEYVGALADTVASIVDWNDPRQVCILSNSVDPPEQLADHARVVVPCLLKRYESTSALVRGSTVAILVRALAKGRSELDAKTIQKVRQIILSTLHDPDAAVKIPTLEALERFGGEDMIPALQVVADKDPDPSEGYAIRKWAADAIVAIQKRAGQH
jgi:hypothetical protein